ncbi:MAG: hypothetical protein CM15mP83_9360 [Flavobacteriaceae bacterium]|nr:MAG: hypothetical protein CM15mP83_9360 [Flavobacteriaceae bacterium]
MPVSLRGDQPFENTPSLEAKALRINLNENIYGTLQRLVLDKKWFVISFVVVGHQVPLPKQ